MTRDDYLALLDRALVSAHGIKLDYADDATARRVRAKLYRLRDEIRAEATADLRTLPAVTYDTNGKLLGLIDIVKRRARPLPTPYNRLQMRVSDGDLYILPVDSVAPDLDELEPPAIRELDLGEASQLTPWPPWGRVNPR